MIISHRQIRSKRIIFETEWTQSAILNMEKNNSCCVVFALRAKTTQQQDLFFSQKAFRNFELLGHKTES
jgi:hypothetical protein